MIPLNEAIHTLEQLQKMQMHTYDDLCSTIEEYMEQSVDGKQFGIEKDLERALRDLLESDGFEVLEKRNVKNTQELCEVKSAVNVDAQVPDISIQCAEGLVFLELKFQRELNDYIDDLRKVQTFLKKQKCSNAGVLFLDNQKNHTDWKMCNKNSEYSYLWAFGSEAINSALEKHSALQEQNKINDLITRMDLY